MPRAVIPARFDGPRVRQQVAAVQRDLAATTAVVEESIAAIDTSVPGGSSTLNAKFGAISSRLNALDGGGPLP